MLIRLPNGELVNEYGFRLARPNVSFPAQMSEENVVAHGGAVVRETQPPTYNIATHYAATDGVELIDGVWTQKWKIVALTPEEIAERQEDAVESRIETALGVTIAELKAALGL